MKAHFLLGFIGVLLCVAPSAHTAPDSLDPVTVTGRSDDVTGIATTASEGRVGHAELSARPLLRVGEVLEVIPGFIATQHSGTGKANQYFLRGFNLDHGTDFAASVDGVPANLPTHGHGQGYLDLNFLIPELVRSVDFRKGPYTASSGDFASAGSAEIRSFDVLPESFLKLGIGEDAFLRMVAAHQLQLEEGHLIAAGEFHAYDGPWNDPEDLEKINLLLRLVRGDRDAGWTLSGTWYDSQWNSTDQIPARAVEQGVIDRLGAINPTNGGRTERAGITWRGWTDAWGGRTQLDLWGFTYDFALWSDFTYFLDDRENGDQFRQFDDRRVFGATLLHDWRTEAQWVLDHRVGLQLRHDDIREVGLEQTRDRRFVAPIRRDAVEQTSIGVFGETTAHWSDTFRTIAGLRGDAVWFDVTSRDLPENSGTADDTIVSPKLSAVMGPFGSTEFYASAGLGFHSNDARGTTIVTDPGGGGLAEPVDPLVRSVGYEAGVRSVVGSAWHTTLALWALDLDEELLFVGDAGNTEASGASERWGVEWSNFYTASDTLRFDLDLAWVESRLKDAPSDENKIPGALPFVLAAGMTYGGINGPFGSLRARHFQGAPLVEDGSVEAPDTTLVNLQVGWRFQERGLSLHLDVLNLLDREDNDITYYYPSQLATETAPVDDVHFHPVEPRSFRVYVRKAF